MHRPDADRPLSLVGCSQQALSPLYRVTMTDESIPAAQPGAVRPTGQQIILTGAGYRAAVTEVGAHLRELSWQGRPLIRGFAADRLPPMYSGAVLAPWPNRLGGGHYTFQGQQLQLPINEVDRGNALHGMVFDRPWTIADIAADSVILRCRVWPTEGYPFQLDLELRYQLDERGLSIDLTAVNGGSGDAPYGCSFHP